MNAINELLEREPDDKKVKTEDVNDKKPVIREGLTKHEGYGFIVGIILLAMPIAVYILKNIYHAPYKFFKTDFENILSSTEYNKDEFTKIYTEFGSILNNNKVLNHKHVLLLFVGFAYMAFLVNLEDENLKEPSKWIVASIVGAAVFILKFIPSVIGFFENTFGYFFVNLFSSLNLTLSLQNKNLNGYANIKMNELLTLFSVENLGEKFTEIGLTTGDNKPVDDGALFALFNVDQDNGSNKKNIYDFFERLLNASILKRAIGETTMLVLTTLITISLFKQ